MMNTTTATGTDTVKETIYNSLLSELGFDLSHGFLAKVAGEISDGRGLSEGSRDALTLREVGLIEACCEGAFGASLAQAA